LKRRIEPADGAGIIDDRLKAEAARAVRGVSVFGGLLNFFSSNLTRRTLLFVLIPLIFLSYFGSLASAIFLSAIAYDWRYSVISHLISPRNNPKFHAVASFGIAITGLLIIPFAGYINRRMRVASSLGANIGTVAFASGAIWLILAGIRELGAVTGRLVQAEQLYTAAHSRLQNVVELTKKTPRRPRVLCLEWIDPYYCCGHWVPEMVELAGGEDALGRKGADSVPISWTDIAALSPEILIVSPCGFGAEEAAEQAKQLLQQRSWNDLPAILNDRVFAVNANAYFARPGPRVVDGVELPAHLIHPKLCDWRGSRNAFRKIHFSDIPSRRDP